MNVETCLHPASQKSKRMRLFFMGLWISLEVNGILATEERKSNDPFIRYLERLKIVNPETAVAGHPTHWGLIFSASNVG